MNAKRRIIFFIIFLALAISLTLFFSSNSTILFMLSYLCLSKILIEKR